MRVAVYNGHLATLGGGEQYSLAIVKWLLARGEQVDILAPAGTSLEACEERLRVRISDGARLVGLDGEFPYCEREATARSGDYDLFFNTSYASRAPSRAQRSVLVVYFPLPVGELPHLGGAELEAWTAEARSQTGCVHPDSGLHHPETQGRWTDGTGSYLVGAGAAGGAPRELTISLSASRPRPLRRADASILLDGTEVARRRLPRSRPVELSFPVPPGGEQGPFGTGVTGPERPFRVGVTEHRRISIATDTYSPSSTGSSDDHRTLGAFIRRVSFSGAAEDDAQPLYGCQLRFLDTYQQVVATSRYSATWLRRYWGTDARVVYPPVSPPPGRPADERSQSIVVLGRFYGGQYSKKQLELTRAFADLCDDGLTGWTLRLVGGVNDEDYFDRVRAAASGYPVELVPNAPGHLMEELLGEASLLWHATGWGDDPEESPDRFEHFGIAVVEAMGAGAVPVVLDVGGPTEIIHHGRDGLLWSADDGPAEASRMLMGDAAMRAAMAARAQARAADFSGVAFEAALDRELSRSPAVA